MYARVREAEEEEKIQYAPGYDGGVGDECDQQKWTGVRGVPPTEKSI